MTGRGRGRPRLVDESGGNRAAIVASARELFSDHGFDRTTMRAIGKRAGVDPALIHHYFGTKDALLVEALRPEIDVEAVFAGVDAVHSPGIEFVRRLVGFWEGHPEARARVIALMKVATTRDEIAAEMREFQLGVVRSALSRVVTDDDPELRYGLVATQIFGLALMRYIVKVPAIRDATADELAALVGPVVQGYLTGPLGAPAARR
ncbi:TetR family transcriptional regulator [Gordonia sp. SL306]|uniref:TetR/AcrR family transcriptional regulator n=1 Tax=Gordonia sp. SL306 TaxID=2995145 RepID=UPI0022710AA3|nr:TetR family transcriptional regulator [Gordonia sp. SL306]WAC55625.1 TetR family transcriptional regulator [Gordonia sp. SL306]